LQLSALFPGASLHMEEVLDHLATSHGEDTLRVELHALEKEFLVTNTLDDARSAIWPSDPRRDLETLGKGDMSSGERVIPGHRNLLVQASEDTSGVMHQGRCLSMKVFACRADIATIYIKDALATKDCCSAQAHQGEKWVDLQSHTDAENGNLASKVTNGISTDPGIGAGVSGPRADDDLSWFLGNELLDGYLVVSVDVNNSTLEDEVLVDIPGERVIVVNEN
jgi:hypothetical protein